MNYFSGGKIIKDRYTKAKVIFVLRNFLDDESLNFSKGILPSTPSLGYWPGSSWICVNSLRVHAINSLEPCISHTLYSFGPHKNNSSPALLLSTNFQWVNLEIGKVANKSWGPIPALPPPPSTSFSCIRRTLIHNNKTVDPPLNGKILQSLGLNCVMQCVMRLLHSHHSWQ